MAPTLRPATPAGPAWLAALQIAIIVAAIALSLFPQARIGVVVAPFLAASLANCALMVRDEWRSGRLSMTPGQLLERARAGEKFPRRALGLAAVVASAIAEWHVTMG
jgi:hypothetical protein